MRLIERLARPRGQEERLGLSDLVMGFGGFNYALSGSPLGPPGVASEPAPSDFTGMVRQVYERNGIVAACVTARMSLVSEARFAFRRLDDKTLFGSAALALLERPTPNATSGDILARFEQDASLSGNGYRVLIGGRLHRVRPDWMHIVLGSNMADRFEVADAPDATVAGYIYWSGDNKYEPVFFAVNDVAHYAPEPDPLARFRGTSWMSQVLTEIDTDRQLTDHKASFLERGATPSFAIRYPDTLKDRDVQERLVSMFRERHEGVSNAWKALHLFGGADPVTLGSNLRDLDYRAVQGAGETRIASRARVPASVLGISEGLAGSALNAGNFGQARRQFGEQYAYPAWRLMCEALAPLVAVPAVSELWYDVRDVAFLHEDARDAAEVLHTQAQAIRTLTDGGYEPDAVVTAVTGGDLSTLKTKHTGLVPVQLQLPGGMEDNADAEDNGPSAPASDNGEDT